MTQKGAAAQSHFTGYQKFVIAILSFLQFTIILDFMIVSPLGAMVMPALKITPSQFGMVVSAYAFSAGIAGFLAAGFADRFDRKKFLLFFYVGFLAGTLFCGMADNFPLLLAARTITGFFGGVIGSIVFAITTDLFPLEMRGRVMGFVQTSFSASQILGLPAGLYFSNHWGWHAPFMMIVAVSLIVGIVILFKLKPISAHLKMKQDHNPLHHLAATVTEGRYLLAFATTALLSIGGFMLMPFGTTFLVHNLGISMEKLPLIYLIVGIFSIVIGPLVGKACDAFGNFPTFFFGTMVSLVMVVIYTHLGPTPLPWVIVVNTLMFIGIFSRMIPSQALMSAIPAAASRGSFMSVSSSLQQISGGFASIVAGAIVSEGADGSLVHFEVLGYVMIGTALFSLFMMNRLRKLVPQTTGRAAHMPLEG